jgi:protease secretion system outer membrane protein
VIVRVVNAYLDVLFKGDICACRVQRDMYVEQRKVNDRTFEKGEGTAPTCWKPRPPGPVEAALETQDALVTSLDTLSGIVGSDVAAIDPLVPDFRIRPEDGASFDGGSRSRWTHNPDIRLCAMASISRIRKSTRRCRPYAASRPGGPVRQEQLAEHQLLW